MRFKNITVLNIKTTVFLGAKLCLLVHWYRYFWRMPFQWMEWCKYISAVQ